MAREKIIEIRKLRKLSQSALGKLAGLTSSEISRIECGYRDVTRQEATSISKALGVSLVAIYDKPETLVPPKPAGMAAIAALKQPAAKPEPKPVSSSLDDPKNFQELPDVRILEQNNTPVTEWRARVTELLKRANAVLHTSGVPAPVWRAWREFERLAQDKLRLTT